ncbi:hypothetical protein JCM15519_38230 [Fundidesulfovibrio butyratiphilus]
MPDLANISQIVAAGVGAAAALVVALLTMTGLFINARFSRKSELRLAYRKTMEEKYSKIGSSIYQIVALSSIVIKKYKANQDVNEQINKLGTIKEELEKCRLETRYSLWGLDPALNLIKKLPSYVLRCKTRTDLGLETITSATSLREALDNAIMYSYLHGVAPSKNAVQKVNRCCAKLRENYSLVDTKE